MQELKFRIWNKSLNRWSIDEKLGRNLDGRESFTLNLDYAPKEHYIISQYTGVKDRNGKEIYNGDIIRFDLMTINNKCYDSKFYQIRFLNGRFVGKKIKIKCDDDIIDDFTIHFFNKTIEIIGNIFENPELCKN